MTPIAAMREPWVCSDDFRAADIPVLQTPSHQACIPAGGLWIKSYADMAAACGFQTVGTLWPTVLCWTALLDLVRPHVMVTDYSPLATLAAFDRCPVVAIGDGFVLPPPQLARMPAFRSKGSNMANEETLIANAEIVMKRLQRRGPPALPALIGGQEHIVCTFPELDVYDHLRLTAATGPVDAVDGPLPTPERPRIFLYLSGRHASTSRVVEAARSTGIHVEAFIRDLDSATAASLRTPLFTLHDTGQEMADVLERCSVLVHHGGIGTLEKGLAAGRPQMIVPAHLEQNLNSMNAKNKGYARVATRSDDVAAFSSNLSDLAASEEKRNIAMSIAATISTRNKTESLQAIVAACLRQAA